MMFPIEYDTAMHEPANARLVYPDTLAVNQWYVMGRIAVTALMSEMPITIPALLECGRNDINETPMIPGTAQPAIQAQRFALAPIPKPAVRTAMMLTTPDGMLKRAACLGLKPSCLIRVVEKVLIAPLEHVS
jgi:hypothetical protein